MAVAFLVTCQCDRQCPVSLLRGGQGTDHSHSTQFKHTSVLVYTTPASDCEQANMCTHQWAQCPPTPSLTWLILIPASLSCSLCSTSCFRYVSRQVVEPQLSADTSSALGRTCVEGIHHTTLTAQLVLLTQSLVGAVMLGCVVQGEPCLSRWWWRDRLPRGNN